jgi:hypothetical protein
MALLQSADRAEIRGVSKPRKIIKASSLSDATVFAASKDVTCTVVCTLLKKMAVRTNQVLQLLSAHQLLTAMQLQVLGE